MYVKNFNDPRCPGRLVIPHVRIKQFSKHYRCKSTNFEYTIVWTIFDVESVQSALSVLKAVRHCVY